VDRRSVLSVQPMLLGEDRPDAFLRAQSGDLVLPGDDPVCGKFVGDEAVLEGGIVGVDGQCCDDQMCVIPIALRHRRFSPLVERLSGELKHPAGHRDGHTVIGKVEDQRAHHFGLTSLDRYPTARRITSASCSRSLIR
jgi:hypothetical protein